MSEVRRKYDPEFREGAVRIVRETSKSIVRVAKDLGLHPGTLGNWVKKDRIERGETEGLTVDERARLVHLESENVELRMERDLLKTALPQASMRGDLSTEREVTTSPAQRHCLRAEGHDLPPRVLHEVRWGGS